MKTLVDIFKRANDLYFNGASRDTRMQYWGYILVQILLSLTVGIMLAVVGANADITDLVNCLVSWYFIIPTINAARRRMHDSGNSGWWLLFPIVNLVMLCFGSEQKSNEYGEQVVA